MHLLWAMRWSLLPLTLCCVTACGQKKAPSPTPKTVVVEKGALYLTETHVCLSKRQYRESRADMEACVSALTACRR